MKPLIAALLLSGTAMGQPDSCHKAETFEYFHCENYSPIETDSVTLCYVFITGGGAVDFNFGYFAFCPDLQVEYTLYNLFCDPLVTNTTGFFDVAPGVGYIVCGTVACDDTTGLGIAQVCTAELLALPVEFLGMTGYATDAGVTLAWSTATERGSDRFEIFRMRTNLDRGELIASLRAAGYSSGRIDYRWTDVRPNPGMGFYRLEGVDTDGSRRMLMILPVTWAVPDRSSLGPFDLLGRKVK